MFFNFVDFLDGDDFYSEFGSRRLKLKIKDIGKIKDIRNLYFWVNMVERLLIGNICF